MNRFIKESLSDLPPYSAGKKLPNAIKLSSNENPLGPCPLAIKAAADCLSGVHRYPDGMSLTLREKLAKMNGLTAENIIVGNGSDELIVFACGAVMNTGDEGITSETTFSEYRFAIKNFGGECKSAPLKGGKYDLEGLNKKISEKTKIVFLCNPNNPTGTYFTESELTDFLEKTPSDVIVFLDEAYFDYAESKDYPRSTSLIKKWPNLIISRTYSKIYGLAALRVGYAMGAPELIDALFRAKHAFNVNLAAQVAASAAVDDKEFYEKSRQMTFVGKKYLYENLERLGVSYYPTESNFICMTFKTTAPVLYKAIAERGIVIRDLTSFGLDHSIRYTVGTKENNKLFISIIEELIDKGICLC